jgi:carboxypeptidase C (cathepsin A)
MVQSLVLCLALLVTPFGQRSRQAAAAPEPTESQAESQKKTPDMPPPAVEEKPVITRHEIKAGGKTLKYTATAGMMPMKNQAGQLEANSFVELRRDVSGFIDSALPKQ